MLEQFSTADKINGRGRWNFRILNVGSLLRGHQRLSAILCALKPIRKRDICMAVKGTIVMRKPLHGKSVDLTGRKFGRLTVLEFKGFMNSGGLDYSVWQCRCDCGTVDNFRVTAFSRKNCGCGRCNRRPAGVPAEIVGIWRGMIARCHCPGSTAYAGYGGRGISVCERWRSSVELFAADIGPRPSPKHSLDRRDNNGNYEPDNCRWATLMQQFSNTRSCRYITFQGITLTHAGWARACGKTREAFRWMVRHHGEIETLKRYSIDWAKAAELSAEYSIPESAAR